MGSNPTPRTNTPSSGAVHISPLFKSSGTEFNVNADIHDYAWSISGFAVRCVGRLSSPDKWDDVRQETNLLSFLRWLMPSLITGRTELLLSADGRVTMLLEKKFIYLNFSSYFLGMLRLKNVVKTFGALRAVDNVSLEVNEKEIVGLIGPNGSGKTTLFNLIMGALHPESGKIIFQGRDITNLPPFKICHLGINRVHQIPRPFLKMTVIDNVITAYLYGRRGNKYEARSKALEALEFVGLKEKALLSASALNLYERKLLEISRSLVTGCKLLLLDEIIAGLNPAEMERAENMIRKIRDELGITIFWIEHVMKAIKKVAERVIVMNQGKKIAEGKFEEIASNEEVIKAYLGEKP